MKAFTYIDKGIFGFVDKPKPTVIEPTDAVVRVTMSSICTSDLHIKHGSVPRAVKGITVGHEMVGVVEEVGTDVCTVKPGDRVTVNVETFCGECFFCKHADDIMTRGGLKRYQTEYAAAMEQFGLRRGEENSPARHKDLAEYYKEHCEEMHARLDEVLSDLAKVERLVEDKDTEIRHRDDIIRRKEDEISQRDFELEKKDREIARQQRTLEELLPRIEKEQGRFDTLFTANEYLEGVELSADRLLEAYDSRESEVSRIESEALDRINSASISFWAKKDVERLAKENAGLKLLVSSKDTEIQKERNETEKERKARERAEAGMERLKETVSGVHSSLERRHPEETRLLRELVSIEITEPKLQDRILSGEAVTIKPYPWKDPSNGNQIPREYWQDVTIKKEGSGNDSFISMCGMRIADFFRNIWAKVTEALGLKRRQEEEQRRQKPDTPKRGFRR